MEGEERGFVVGDQRPGSGAHTGGVGLEELLSAAADHLPPLAARRREELAPLQATARTTHTQREQTNTPRSAMWLGVHHFI